MAKKSSSEMSSPSSLPESTPPVVLGGHGDFTLSTVIEIHRTLGKVEQAIENLSKESAIQNAKLDDIGKTVHAGKVLLAASGVVLGVLGSIAVFFLNKIWDLLVPLLSK